MRKRMRNIGQQCSNCVSIREYCLGNAFTPSNQSRRKPCDNTDNRPNKCSSLHRRKPRQAIAESQQPYGNEVIEGASGT